MLFSTFHLSSYSSSSSGWCFMVILVVVNLSCSVYHCHGSCNQRDEDSLSSFNHSISPPNPLNWSLSVDCCSWEGVGCDESDRVNSLLLPSRGLIGSLSPSIANLTSLTQLNLSQNRLSGPLPDGLFTALNRLVIIDLSHNDLARQLSDSDKLTTTATTVDLSGNLFHGTIKSSFFQTALNLRRFDVSDNSFSGSIPSLDICRFSPSIQHLDFSNNDFDGPILQGFDQCRNLLSLKAGFNNLSGTIPSDIYMVSSLQELFLPANKLSGVIEGSVVNLINLRVLALYGNELKGRIPQDIGKLSNLEELSLHINRLNGTLPKSLTYCTRLTTLNLRDNLLGGELSDFDFSKFIHLRSVDLGINFFTGRLPASLFSCKNLTTIRLAVNSLNGEVLPDIIALKSLSFLSLADNRLNNIASAMRTLAGCKNLRILSLAKNFNNERLPGDKTLIRAGEFKNLQILGLAGCGFMGPIPIWLSRIEKLEALDLSYNNIMGSIPSWLGNLPDLHYLDLSHNLISGNFPVELTGLRGLIMKPSTDQVDLSLPVFVHASNRQYKRLSNLPQAINLRSNNITGPIPVEIGQLKFIAVLDLSNNKFFGSIPETISHLTNLETLDLSNNRLSGEIPRSLKNLHFLSFLSLAYNNLEGPIPIGGQFDTFSNSSFARNPRLCGEILQRSCASEPRSTPDCEPSTRGTTGGKNEIINWKIFGICFGISFILAILADLKFFRWILRWYSMKLEHSWLPHCMDSDMLHDRYKRARDEPAASLISPTMRVPNIGELKINTAATLRFGEHYIGIGAVIRDHDGVVVAAFSQRMIGGFQREEATAFALREGLRFAKNNGFKLAVVECDSLRIIRCLNSDYSMISYATILYDIVALLEEVNCHTCQVTPEAGNQPAHILSSFAISKQVVCNWLDCIPIFLSDS